MNNYLVIIDKNNEMYGRSVKVVEGEYEIYDVRVKDTDVSLRISGNKLALPDKVFVVGTKVLIRAGAKSGKTGVITDVVKDRPCMWQQVMVALDDNPFELVQKDMSNLALIREQKVPEVGSYISLDGGVFKVLEVRTCHHVQARLVSPITVANNLGNIDALRRLEQTNQTWVDINGWGQSSKDEFKLAVKATIQSIINNLL